MADHLAAVSRKLRARADSIIAGIWAVPEMGEGFPSLAARVAPAGDVAPEAAGALLAPINPARVQAQVATAWATMTAAALVKQRMVLAERELTAAIGPAPDGIERALALLRPAADAGVVEGHALFAGQRSLPIPDAPVSALFRACDMVREHRGASHTNAWVSAGLDAVEINLISELWRGMPPRSVTCAQMAWSHDDADAAVGRLADRGLITRDANTLTDDGRELRDAIEVATDRQEASIVDALGDDADELLGLLEPWARAVMATMAGRLPPVR
jgi:hypothetical protein